MAPVIDAHHHFWEIAARDQAWRTEAHAAIAADYRPAELRPALRENGVDATVLVQSVDTPRENDRLARYAAAAPFVAGVVGWLPLRDPEAARRELDRVRSPLLRGVRCLVGREPIDRLAEPDALALFADLAAADLVWEVVPVTGEQAATVARVAEEVPDLRVVVDHLARPPLDGDGWPAWERALRELARAPNIAMKVSVGLDVLTGWAAWDGEALTAPVAHAVRHFGPDRLMLASNWPVVLLRADYGRALADQTAALRSAGLRGADRDAVTGGTAAHWYRLAPAAR